MNLTIRQITEATGGTLVFSGSDRKQEAFVRQNVDHVVLDSRKVSEGGVFIATVGERVDGHSFVSSVFEKGAVLAVVQRIPEEAEALGPYLLVKDTLQALKDIAQCYRKSLRIPVIGITGSVGKTSTKEFIAGVLSEKYCVLKTQGNYNNEIGVPLTLLQIRPEHEVAVIEMGISDFGEMHRLSRMAAPDIAVITNIGQCHLENLIDRDGVLKAKTEIFDFMPEDGKVCLNGDDDKLRSVCSAGGREILFFGTDQPEGTAVYAADVVSEGLWGSSAQLCSDAGESYEIQVPLPGRHMVLNAAAAACVARLLGLEPEEIQAGMKNVAAVDGRNHLIRAEHYTLIDDCYNANPVSMKAGIDLLCTAQGISAAVLGDMFELGENSDVLHAGVGEYAAEKGVDRILCVGSQSRHMYEAALRKKGNSEVTYFETREDLLTALKTEREKFLPEGATVLIKASHGMHFSQVVDLLK